MNPSKQGNRLYFLDGIKGIAILGVVLRHYSTFFPSLEMITGTFWNTIFVVTPLRIVYNGPFWVTVFWFISAFLTTVLYLDKSKHPPLVVSIGKRYLQLVIPVFVATVFMFVALKYSWVKGVNPTYFTNYVYWLKPTLIDMFYQAFITTFFFSKNEYVLSLWFVSVEFISFVLIHLILRYIQNRNIRLVMYVLGYIPAVYFQFSASLFGLVFGEIYDYVRRTKFNFKVAELKLLPLLLLTLIFGSYPSGMVLSQIRLKYQLPFFISDIFSSNLFYSFGLVSLFVMLFNSNYIKKKLSNPILVYLGQRSFSICIFHVFILYLFSNQLFNSLTPKVDYLYASFFMFSISFLFILFGSMLFYTLVEKPGRELVSYLFSKFRPYDQK